MQTSYTEQNAQGNHPGSVQGLNCRSTSRKAGGAKAQVSAVTVDTAVNSTAYSIDFALTDLAGKSVTGSASFTSDASATKEEIRDGLIAAIDADPTLSGYLLADTHTDTDKLTVTARQIGVAFTVTAGANLSQATSTSAATGNNIGFGVLVVEGDSYGECDVARAENATGKVYDATPVAENDAEYAIQIIGDLDGDGREEGYVASYVADSNATVAEICAGLAAAAFEPALPANSVTVADATTKVTLTAAVPGLEFTVNAHAEGANGGAAALDVAVATNGSPLRPLGISIHKHTEQNADGSTSYRAGEDVNIHRGGSPILVQIEAGVTPAAGDPVYARQSATGTEVLSAFRTTPDGADCMLLDSRQFQWVGSPVQTSLSGERVAELRVLLA